MKVTQSIPGSWPSPPICCAEDRDGDLDGSGIYDSPMATTRFLCHDEFPDLHSARLRAGPGGLTRTQGWLQKPPGLN
jgi:hypothetical protein